MNTPQQPKPGTTPRDLVWTLLASVLLAVIVHFILTLALCLVESPETADWRKTYGFMQSGQFKFVLLLPCLLIAHLLRLGFPKAGFAIIVWPLCGPVIVFVFYVALMWVANTWTQLCRGLARHLSQI